MGRATIISETGAGLYVIKPLYDNDLITSQISNLTANIVIYDANIATLEAERDLIIDEYDDKDDELNAAIDVYNADKTAENLAALSTLTAELGEITGRLTNKARELGREKLKKTSAEKRKTKLENLVNDVSNRSAWNVAYVEGLTGEVNTIEINGEADNILIGDFLDPSKLTEILGQTVAGSLFNFSLFPYWQKWNPTHRVGKITALSGNLATVLLDSATSHYQGLNINQSGILYNVPIVYLTCNEAAFNVNDRVVLGFTGQDWSTPVIIGFEDNPVECFGPGGDLKCTFFAQRLVEKWPYSWTVTDIDGDSPDIAMQYPGPAFNRVNYAEDYKRNEILLTATGTDLPSPMKVTIDYSYSGGVYNLIAKASFDSYPTGSNHTWFVVAGSRVPSPILQDLELAGPGIIGGDKTGYDYSPGQIVYFDNSYIPGDTVYINFTYQNDNSWNIFYDVECNPTDILV